MKAIKLTALVTLAASAITANAGVVTDFTTGMKDGMGQMFNTAGNPGAISAEVGTLGYGANVAYGANEYTEVQIGWTGGDLLADAEIEIQDVDFTAKTDFSTPYVGVQVRPMKNWMTVGMGAMFMGNNEITATATPVSGKTFSYNGEDYTVASNAEIDATLEFRNSVAPYLSMGFRPNITNRFGLFGELGVAYTGGIQTDIQALGEYTVNGQSTAFTDEDRQTLEDNARQEIMDKIEDYDDFYPIVKIGAAMRF